MSFTGRANDYQAFAVKASDADGEQLTYTFSSSVAGTEFSVPSTTAPASQSVFNRVAIPDLTVGAVLDILVTVSDGTDSIEFSLSVTVSSVNRPPTVSILIDGGSGLGTIDNPLLSPTSIQFAADVQDPDPIFAPGYLWGADKLQGIWCPGDSQGVLFGGSAQAGFIQIGRLASLGRWKITLFVEDGTHELLLEKEVWVAPPPDGCNPTSGTPPTSVSLTTSLANNTASPGQAFRAIARGTSTDPATFSIFASTTQFKPAIPYYSENRSNCGAGCTVETTLFAPQFGSAYFLWTDVSNSTGTIERSLQLTISTSGGGGDPGGGGGSCSEASPSIASCKTEVDAGCTTVTITGGNTLELEGNIYNPIMDSVPTIGVDSTWQITSSNPPAGVSLQNSSSTHALLITPEVNESATVILSLTGTVDSCTAVDSIEVKIEPVSAGADLALSVNPTSFTKSVNQEFEYEVSVSNSGPGDASGVAITHQVASNMAFVSGSIGGSQCALQGGAVLCNIGSLPNAQSKQGTLTFKGTSAGSTSALASVSGSESDPNSSNNTRTVSYSIQEGSGADLKVTVPGEPLTADVGDDVSYTVTVSNLGPQNATSVVLTHPVPDFLDYLSGISGLDFCREEGSNVTCSFDTLNNGSSKNINFKFKAIGNSDAPVTLSVDGAQEDPESANNSASITYDFELTTGADLAVTGPAEVQSVDEGDSFSYSIQVTNNGPEDVEDGVLRHSIPGALDYVSGSFGTPSQLCDLQGSQVVCEFGSLAKDESIGFQFRFEAVGSGETSANVEASSDAKEDPISGNSSVQVSYAINAVADLRVAAGTLTSSLVPGQPFEFQLQVENFGPSTADDVFVDVTLPNEVNVQSYGLNELVCSETEVGLGCSIGDLDSGQTVTLAITLLSNVLGEYEGAASVESPATDPVEGNNTASFDLVVQEAAALIFPHSVSSSGPFPSTTFIGIAVYNPNNQPTDVEFIAFDANGQQVGAPVLLSELEQTLLQPNGQIARTAGDVFPGVEGVTALTARGVNGRVQGFFLLGNGVTSLDGVAGNLLESRKLYFPVARESENESTNLILYNTSVDQSADVLLTLYDRSGDPLEIERFDLAKQGTVMDSVRNVFDVDQVDGYVLVESDIPVKGVEIYTNGEEISAIGAQESREVRRLIVPHFFFLDEDDTRLRILNVGKNETLASMKAYDDSGNFLSGGFVQLDKREMYEGKISELLNLPSDAFTGYLVIDFEPDWSDDSALSSIIGMVTFSTGKAKTLASLPLAGTGSIHSKFLHIAQSSQFGLFTGLAILNSSSKPADVTVKVFNSEGQLVREKVLSQVQPGARVLKLLGEVLEDPSFEALGGHFEIESSRPVMVFALFGDSGQRYLAAIEGQAP